MGWRKTTLTILSGQTESGVLDLAENGARRPKAIAISVPVLAAEVVNPQMEVGGIYQIVQSGGSDIALTSERVTQLDLLTGSKLKLVATAGVGANRVFQLEGTVVGGIGR